MVIAGASGLVGHALIAHVLESDQFEVLALSRRPRQSHHPKLRWVIIPSSENDLSELIDGADTVINLAGDNIGSGPWNRKKKKAIVDSRVGFTQQICQAIAICPHKPRLYLQASALGFYGSSLEEKDESWPVGEGFLSKLCRDWEQASHLIEPLGVRRILCRFAVVLSSKGGLLPRMATPFRFGLGSILGSGKQWFSWIHIADLCQAMMFLLQHKDTSGIFNICSPHPVQHRQFMKLIAQTLQRPLLWRIPASMLRLVMGEMANELLLSSIRILPTRLSAHGFLFAHPKVDAAVDSLLSRQISGGQNSRRTEM